jgi:hypothetical protein
MTRPSTLSPEAAALQHERLGRVKIENEREWIGRLVALERDRLAIVDEVRAAGRFWGLTLAMSVRTCVRGVDDEHPRIERRDVEVTMAVGGYPFSPPQIVLRCDAPLYLPGVMHVGEHASPCLYRGPYDHRRMDLGFFVTQTWRALTVVPTVLNSVDDALNGEAALWFIRRRDTLELPLDAPLVEPNDDRTSVPARRFTLKRVR